MIASLARIVYSGGNATLTWKLRQGVKFRAGHREQRVIMPAAWLDNGTFGGIELAERTVLRKLDEDGLSCAVLEGFAP